MDRPEKEAHMATQQDEYVPVGPVAKLLKVSPQTVARWSIEGYRAKDGTLVKIPCVYSLGGHRRYSVRVANELAAAHDIAERL
jgi:hypothetical protein